MEIIKELDEYFVKAGDSGEHVSFLLEASSSRIFHQRSSGKVYNYGKNLSLLTWTWGSNLKSSSFNRFYEEMTIRTGGGGGGATTSSHCSTVERLYAWRRKYLRMPRISE